MKCFFILLIVNIGLSYGFVNYHSDKPSIDDVLLRLESELEEIQRKHHIARSDLLNGIIELDKELNSISDRNRQLDILIEKSKREDLLKKLNENEYLSMSKIRYLKGIDIIKILYEKVLSLDHHFTSVRSLSELNKLSNPNNYAQFEKLSQDLKRKNRKKGELLKLTDLLSNNLFANITKTLINISNSGYMSNLTKKEQLEIECVMDFTLRMYQDLNTVYYETAFLQSHNESIKLSIEKLFLDYVQVINYQKSLLNCRSMDDWDELRKNLQNTIEDIYGIEDPQQNYRRQVDIEFSIDRLLQYISKYNDFICMCEQFYNKFKIILSSYENENICIENIQSDFAKMKFDIDKAIKKFKIAYRPVEINGSKLKGILYGLKTYE